MIMHNELIKFLDNINIETVRKFKAVIFKKKHQEDFLYFGVYLLKEAKELYDSKVEPYVDEKQWIKNRYKYLKINVLLGLGSEYFLKSIFLKKGYAVNRLLNSQNIQKPYKIYGNTKNLNPEESTNFAYIRNNFCSIVNLKKFDKEIERLNKEIELRNKTQKLANIKKIEYRKMNSKEVLIYLWGLRNNALHNAYIKPEFKGIFRDIWNFLDFVSNKVYKKGIFDFN